MPPLISGHVVIRAAVQHDFPIRECVRSLLPSCDEVVVLVDPEPDGTIEWCEEVAREGSPGQVRLLIEPWWDLNGGKELLSRATNRCIEACTGKYHLHLQADEAIREDCADSLRALAEKGKVDWAYLPWLHFWIDGTRRCADPERICQQTIRFARRRLFPKFCSYGDAMSLGTPTSSPRGLRSETLEQVPLYHYGYICKPQDRGRHEYEMSRLLEQSFDDRTMKEETFQAIIPAALITPFTDPHPLAMQPWLSERGLSGQPKPTGLLDPEQSREYYAHVCKGDSGPQLDPENYEWPRIQWLLSQVRGTALDVGCCTGEFVKLLQRQGHWAIGLDPSEHHIRTARERYPDIGFSHGFAEDYGLWIDRAFSGHWKYETVVAGDVLEHVPDDRLFLEQLRRLGRRVVMTTPLGRWDSPEHVREYTEASAKALVAGSGGTVEVISDRAGKPRWLGLTCEGVW